MKAQYKIGITEAGDAGIDLSWADKLDSVDGAIIITKNLTDDFQSAILAHKEKIILHTTVTGYGGSVLEPNVPFPNDQLARLVNIVLNGFPKNHVVIRIDPIIPTEKGIRTAENTAILFADHGFSRFRVSVIDMYPHVRLRFAEHHLKDPYCGKFQADASQFARVDNMIERLQNRFDNIRIEACAEPSLHNAIQCGCISLYDLELLEIHDEEAAWDGYQRQNCMCYSGKVELLQHKKQCPHGCLYCYWK